MKAIYEIYFDDVDNNTVYCGTVEHEKEAIQEVAALQREFPENYYWYEIVGID